MKKYILLFLIGIISCLSFTKVNAETLIHEELENGKVSLSISSDQGYMDTIDTTITVQGNVIIESFSWASSLNDMASKEYQIANDKKSIHIVLTSRAINIINTSKEIEIGTVKVSGNSTTNYHFELANFSYSNLDKEHNSASNLYTKNTETLTYQKESTNTPSIPEKNENQNPENNNNQENNQQENTSSNQQSTSNQNNNSSSAGSNSTQNNTNHSNNTETVNGSEEENQDEKENQEENDSNTEEKETGKIENNKEEQKENASFEQNDDESNNIIIYTSIVVIVVLALSILLLLAIRYKKN